MSFKLKDCPFCQARADHGQYVIMNFDMCGVDHKEGLSAYVYCRKVDGVPNGLHHYSAVQHSLEPCGAGPWPEPSKLLPEQVWVDDAAAVVFLVANFDRTMWKYGEAFAYKTILIEAGHIAQNMAVACAKFGLAANPTLGIDDDKIEEAIGVSPPLVSAIYALSIGHPDASIAPFETKGDRTSF